MNDLQRLLGGRKDRTVFATIDGVFILFSIELRSQFTSLDVLIKCYKARH